MIYDTVGGRVKDLEHVVANIDSGRTPETVCNELLSNSIEKIRR